VSPRSVFVPYARLFRVPGALAFSLAGWLARLPIPMVGLGTVLLVVGETGSYGLAGTLSGVLALSFSIASPQWARAIDRRGQGVVLRLSVACYLVSGLAFALAVVLGAPHWLWFVLAVLTGGSEPNIGALVRARWAHALDAEGRRTAFAFESVVDEVVFVVGPPFVTLLATLVAAPAGFLTGLGIGVAGGMWLAGQRASEPPVQAVDPAGPSRRSVLLTPTMLVVGVVYLAIGTVFGAMDVVVVGFAREEGAPAMAGLVLAAYAAGSLVAGLVYGVARLPGTLAARFVGCAVLFAVAGTAVLAVGSLTAFLPVAFLAGLAIAPVLVSGMSLVESRVPRQALTEALTWTNTGLTLGVTAGSALAGIAVDAWGAQPAFAVPAVAGGLAGVLALAGAPLLSRVRSAETMLGATSAREEPDVDPAVAGRGGDAGSGR
jgi:predicted MFS family arabinose efflux permease